MTGLKYKVKKIFQKIEQQQQQNNIDGKYEKINRHERLIKELEHLTDTSSRKKVGKVRSTNAIPRAKITTLYVEIEISIHRMPNE